MSHDAIAMLINNLRGKSKKGDPGQFAPEKALAILRDVTKQDFGYDAEAWENWIASLEMRTTNHRISYGDEQDNT